MGTILYFVTAAFCLLGPLRMIRKPKRERKSAQNLIIATEIIAATVFCLMGCLSIEALRGNVWIELAFSTLVPFIGYFYFLAVRSLTSAEGITAKDFIMLIPIALLLLSGYVFDIFMGKEIWSQYVATVFNNTDISFDGLDTLIRYRYYGGYWGIRIFLLVELWYVFFKGSRLLKAYNHEIGNYYSELKGLADSTNTYTTGFSWYSVVISTLFVLSESVPGSHMSILTVIASLAAIVLFYLLGLYAYNIEKDASDLAALVTDDKEQESETNIISATGNETTIEKYAKALKQAIAEQVYLEPGLELTELAERLGTNRTYLSNIIHDEYGQNFSEFINSRRISYAVKLMTEAAESYPVRYVAMKCGYKSLQSFYNNFAKYTGGKTPASFIKK